MHRGSLEESHGQELSVQPLPKRVSLADGAAVLRVQPILMVIIEGVVSTLHLGWVSCPF